jgi:3-hydroxyacyl-[acyl-carrier-protein] dehydratase
VRFVFVDRIVELQPGASIETLKSVAASEDYFADHFPGFPVMPGALVLESMVQSAALMLGAADGFAAEPRLAAVRRAAFRRMVRPGDRLTVRCEAGPDGVVRARAEAEGRIAATALLEFERGGALAADHPLRALWEALRADPGEAR